MEPFVGYTTRKCLRYLISGVVIVTLIFLIPRMMPGDPFLNILGEELYYSSPDLVSQLTIEFGLDRPLPEQYVAYILNLFQGDWGYSYHYMQPVLDLILFRLKWTLVLLVPSLVLGVIIGVVAGAAAGWRQGGRLDSVLTPLSLFVYATPRYWLAMLSVFVFSFTFPLFPLCGICSGGMEGVDWIVDVLWHMALPVAVLTVFNASYYVILMRNSVVQVKDEDYVLTARAIGMAKRDILRYHVVKNAVLPVITMIALDFGFLVSGALLVEIIFSWGGMGTLIYDAVIARDYPLLNGSFLMIALCVMVANFCADLLYAVLDPRVRGGGEA
ncbi:ABC transporter permease [Methanoculleus sp. 10]|uniref:ABC transporter permease n=1 Tax=Methanoculleus sp. 10 TaxID=430615 RepID=UPI0025CFFB4C|nr:ABC transporter permease [Methanoculleus sp. 10]